MRASSMGMATSQIARRMDLNFSKEIILGSVYLFELSLIGLDALSNIFVNMRFAVAQQDHDIAQLLNLSHRMADQNDFGGLQAGAEGFCALAPEMRVTHGHDLVDEVIIEIKSHAHAEGQPGFHAGGI